MRPRWGYPATALIGALVLPIAVQKDGMDRPRTGQLVVVGGGVAVPAIFRRALDTAGGPSAYVVVVPHASTDPQDTARRCVEYWSEAGAERVEPLLDLADPSARRALTEADLIWFCGGSQTRLMEALRTADLVDLLRERFRAGAVVGGTSAGAAVLSRVMIAGPAGPRGTPEARLARVEEGLGLWPEVVIDQHFLRRNREERLRGVVAENPTLLGVGIDECTAVIVRGRELEVVGESQVVLLDARAAAAAGPPSGPMDGAGAVAIESIRLEPGSRFDLETGPLAATAAR
jgi:cyanophycinase